MGNPGLLAERYEVGPKLGRGATATVYRAHDRVTDTDVALKLFASEAPPKHRGRDRREIDILTGLRHPGLVEFRDAGTSGDQLFVVTDLVEGESLARALQRRPLSAEAVTTMGVELAEALAYVHSRGVVHRDVKPANILLDADGRPRLADFGIAHLDGVTRMTSTGVVVGTAGYMAPEQVRGGTVGPPADVYALGLVLLEAVTGLREYQGAPLESAVARLYRPPTVPSGLPAPLTDALRRTTATDPADRPTAEEVAELLRAQPAPEPRPRPSARPGRRLVPLAALAILLTSAAGGYLIIRPDAVQTAEPQTPPPAAAPPATSPDAAPSDAAPVTNLPPAPAGGNAPELAAPPGPLLTGNGSPLPSPAAIESAAQSASAAETAAAATTVETVTTTTTGSSPGNSNGNGNSENSNAGGNGKGNANGLTKNG